MSTGDDIPDRRERCGRLQPVPCGAWNEDHGDMCADCDWRLGQESSEDCPHHRWRYQVACPDGKGEFERMTRPSHDD